MLVKVNKLVELDQLHIEALLLNSRTTECFNVNELIQLNQDIQIVNSVIPVVREPEASIGVLNKFSDNSSQLNHIEDMIHQLRA